MPLYEYKCGKCAAVFEQLVRSSTDKPKACPKCGGKKLEKQLSSFSASVHEHSSLPCSSGACSPNSCAGGSCPFSNH
mgnify:CR=1 FL=1